MRVDSLNFEEAELVGKIFGGGASDSEGRIGTQIARTLQMTGENTLSAPAVAGKRRLHWHAQLAIAVLLNAFTWSMFHLVWADQFYLFSFFVLISPFAWAVWLLVSYRSAEERIVSFLALALSLLWAFLAINMVCSLFLI